MESWLAQLQNIGRISQAAQLDLSHETKLVSFEFALSFSQSSDTFRVRRIFALRFTFASWREFYMVHLRRYKIAVTWIFRLKAMTQHAVIGPFSGNNEMGHNGLRSLVPTAVQLRQGIKVTGLL